MKYTKEQLNKYDFNNENLIVHVKSQKEWDKLKTICPNLYNFDSDYNYYLSSNEGKSRTPYYNTIEMEDILWPVELIIGNKYVPHSKTTWGSLQMSNTWKEAKSLGQPYLFYNGLDGTDHTFSCHLNSPGDFFNPEDVTIYEEFVLPEKWYVKVTPENIDILSKWRFKDPTNKLTLNQHTGIPKSHSTPEHDYNTYMEGWINEITFEQFKEHVLKQKEMKIIGYKLKEDCKQFEKAAKTIANLDLNLNELNIYPRTNNRESSLMYKNLKDGNVLDLWFEPVYEQEYKVGDYIYVVSNHTEGCRLNVGDVEEITYLRDHFVTTKRLSSNGGDINFKDFRKATLEEIEKSKEITILGHKAQKISEGVKFGCQTISRTTLESLDNLLNRKEFDFTCKVGNENITKETITKLLNL